MQTDFIVDADYTGKRVGVYAQNSGRIAPSRTAKYTGVVEKQYNLRGAYRSVTVFVIILAPRGVARRSFYSDSDAVVPLD